MEYLQTLLFITILIIRFLSSSLGVILVGMPNTPYKLGSIFCNNRLQRLYHFTFKTKKFTEIADSTACNFSPRFTFTGNHLVYLQNSVGGPHMKASKLIALNWPQKTEHGIIAIPDKPKGNGKRKENQRRMNYH